MYKCAEFFTCIHLLLDYENDLFKNKLFLIKYEY